MKKQITSPRFGLFAIGLPILVVFFLTTACEKENQLIQENTDAATSALLGTYETHDISNGQERGYEMGIRFDEVVNKQFSICNFANLRIAVKAVENDEGLRIIPELFTFDHQEMEIIQGIGTKTADGMKFVFWSRIGKEYYTHEMTGVLINNRH